MRLRFPSASVRWMAVLVFWLAAVLPAASMAAQALSGELAPWTQICRSSLVGPRAAELREGLAGSGVEDQDHVLFQHCAFCHLHQDALPLPPVPGGLAPRVELREGLPERFFSAAVTAHVWRRAPARAPPSVV
ncbi:hypothetical protein FHT39_000683 [Mitsuaria sp. BK045]|uniref:DUF2946 domain-containing protein n=1 Tax=unclassified Roseateles TaxID=2626991 RepID=UPI0016215AAE|nr:MULTISPECIES: DUF2946 domain-containing protein [unclassified Roseateles]MBB3292044.1 hypothetical protein [Mitsuaria sp. BK041]MBB3361261.1 hypothetical protein [Mitsuaria sp. BK045]